MAYRGEQRIKGKTYVYQAIAEWDKDKKRSKQKRIYIGHRDEETGDFIPNKKYYELYGGKPEGSDIKTLPSIIMTKDYGDVYLLNHIAKETGLIGVLKDTFSTCYKELLACAFHLVINKNALYLCRQWAESTWGFDDAKLSSQRISEMLSSLDENSQMNFYRNWASLRQEQEYLALDITSISSYSELIEHVEYGYNRDKEDLPQVNLAMLFGEDTRLPVFCRVYPGSIRDVSTLTGMIQFIDTIKMERMRLVMDRGFYKDADIKSLLMKRTKFSIGVPFTTNLAKDAVIDARTNINRPTNAIAVGNDLVYANTTMINLHSRRAYLHVYYNEKQHISKRTEFMQKLIQTEEGLRNGTVKKENNLVKKYLKLRNSKNGLHINRNTVAIEAHLEDEGFFVILSNDSKDPKYVLDIYRTKDVVEKSFENLKNDLDMDRLHVHSDKTMQGRIFVGFLALILASYIRNVMHRRILYKSYTFSSLLAELKKLKIVLFAGNKSILTEYTKKQKAIFQAFEVDLPR
jgi:transposase